MHSLFAPFSALLNSGLGFFNCVEFHMLSLDDVTMEAEARILL
jgi:hypothetical protein